LGGLLVDEVGNRQPAARRSDRVAEFGAAASQAFT
jgi:hypothetical protein